MTFRINRVYTRSGDTGDTGLVGGKRVSKDDLRVAAYGDVDELNSALGVAKEEITSATQRAAAVIERLQQELFDLGSELATPPEAEYPGMWKAAQTHIDVLERLCDRFGEGLPELTSFILPGGSRFAAALHLARTISRRAERSVVTLMRSGEAGNADHRVSAECAVYLNRISDLLFNMSRWTLAQEKREAPLWTKGEKRVFPE